MTQRSAFGPASRFSILASVYARSFGAEIVLLDFGRGEYFGLDEVGAEIWRGIEKGDSLGEIADRVVERFDVTHEQALTDIIAIVDEMVDNALVRSA